jgi:hypothetical protein
MSGDTWRADFAASPLFHGLRDTAAAYAGHAAWPDLDALNRHAARLGVVTARGAPLRFAHQAVKCGQRAYEEGIHAGMGVPTRAENWHDFFNALIWLAWPLTKAALNDTQRRALGAAGAAGRGPLSDAATLFDESGLVLVGAPRLAELLRARVWRAAFWEQRALWQSARLYVVGHSLLEKSLACPPGITGKCLFLEADAATDARGAIPAWLDTRVAEAWRRGEIGAPADLFPVPILGVPGYHTDNASPGYYDNARVFRPPLRA